VLLIERSRTRQQPVTSGELKTKRHNGLEELRGSRQRVSKENVMKPLKQIKSVQIG
jgi:hypothetical protein